MRLTKKLMFSIEAVIDIAFYGDATPVQSQKIAARRQIPPRYLEQVLQYFSRAKIIKSNRGPRGGYQLARARSDISVGEIARLVQQMEGGTRRILTKKVLNWVKWSYTRYGKPWKHRLCKNWSPFPSMIYVSKPKNAMFLAPNRRILILFDGVYAIFILYFSRLP